MNKKMVDKRRKNQDGEKIKAKLSYNYSLATTQSKKDAFEVLAANNDLKFNSLFSKYIRKKCKIPHGVSSADFFNDDFLDKEIKRLKKLEKNE